MSGLLPLDGPALYGAKAVTTSPIEVKVGASPMEDRAVVTIQPIDGNVWFGYNASVSSSSGTKIFKGQIYPLEASSSLSVFIVTDSGSVDTRITEVG